MKVISIKIPTPIYVALEKTAASTGQTLEEFIVDLLSENAISTQKPNSLPTLDVRTFFPSAGANSTKWAQDFVNTATSYVGVTAFRSEDGRGVGFSPNFVFIEYIRQGDDGFRASFEASPDLFSKYQVTLEPGRHANWSRFDVRSETDLFIALKCLHIAAHEQGIERHSE